MSAFILPFLVGVLVVVLGISVMRGNISLLHSYHRNRVSEEDKIPFGKKVGLGNVITGATIMVYSVLSAITVFTENQIFTKIGNIVMVLGLVAGLGLSLYAIKKYNKSIF